MKAEALHYRQSLTLSGVIIEDINYASSKDLSFIC